MCIFSFRLSFYVRSFLCVLRYSGPSAVDIIIMMMNAKDNKVACEESMQSRSGSIINRRAVPRDHCKLQTPKSEKMIVSFTNRVVIRICASPPTFWRATYW